MRSSRPIYCSTPAKSTQAGSEGILRRFEKWITTSPPYKHPDNTMAGIDCLPGGVEQLLDHPQGHFVILKYCVAFTRVLVPSKYNPPDTYYDILHECVDENSIFQREKYDQKIVHFRADSFKSTASTLTAALNRRLEEKHKVLVHKYKDQNQIPERHRTLTSIDVGSGHYKLLQTVRSKIIEILHEHEEFLSVDEEGNKKKQDQNKNTLSVEGLQKVYRNIHKLAVITPLDLITRIFYYMVLERIHRGGTEYRKYQWSHFHRAWNGVEYQWTINYPKGTKNNKYKNKHNPNIQPFIVSEQHHPLGICLGLYRRYRGDHIKINAFWLQWWPKFRVMYMFCIQTIQSKIILFLYYTVQS